MKRIIPMALTFLAALLTVMLMTTSDGWAQRKKAPRKSAPQADVTNPPTPQATQPDAADPCAAEAQARPVNPCALLLSPCAKQANPEAPPKLSP